MGQNVFWNVWPVVLWLENDANISQKQPVITDTGACLHANPLPKVKWCPFIQRSTDGISSIIWSIGNLIIVPRQCKPWYCKRTEYYSVCTVRWWWWWWCMDLPHCRHKSIPGLWGLHTITLGSRSRCNNTRAWKQQWETAHTSNAPRPKRPSGGREGIQCVKHKQRVKLILSVKQGTSTTVWVYADWMQSSFLEFSPACWFWTCSTEFVSVGMR